MTWAKSLEELKAQRSTPTYPVNEQILWLQVSVQHIPTVAEG